MDGEVFAGGADSVCVGFVLFLRFCSRIALCRSLIAGVLGSRESGRRYF